MSKTNAELATLRTSLLAKLMPEHLRWVNVSVGVNVTDVGCFEVFVEVCLPVVIDDFFLPVTAKETFQIAKKFNALPLTRAIADEFFNQSEHIPPQPLDPNKDILNFEKYSTYLLPRYGDGKSNKKASGAHKLWLLSGQGTSINYGFYVKRGKDASQGGKTLSKDFTVIQSLGGRHNQEHWDYSQLLQIMRATKPLLLNNKSLTLPEAINEGLPGVWDESKKVTVE
ncbi:MAG: hypothetical protein H7Z37_13175 [Pyrinomonadaceae bacterium]|nr:hypothetical protein [Pyrinomonadaceae bacterium]